MYASCTLAARQMHARCTPDAHRGPYNPQPLTAPYTPEQTLAASCNPLQPLVIPLQLLFGPARIDARLHALVRVATRGTQPWVQTCRCPWAMRHALRVYALHCTALHCTALHSTVLVPARGEPCVLGGLAWLHAGWAG